MRRLLPLTAVLAVASSLVPALAGAAPRSTSTVSSIALDQTSPSLGSTVTFTVSHPKSVKYPRVAVRCYQSGALAYAEARNAGEAFVLGGGGSDWLRAGGPADCTAELFWVESGPNTPQVFHTLATTAFGAAG
jgi:hypothetical protein